MEAESRPTQPREEHRRTLRPLPIGAMVVAGVLLVIPMIALALVPTYAGETPVLWGFPFFYWYQFLWILLTPLLTWAAYVVIVRARGKK